ncbi:MAG: pitrilysin family protein [Acidobacteriia bacterium]|nr:pitrilysin family protein [Terriglobia bacterium]
MMRSRMRFLCLGIVMGLGFLTTAVFSQEFDVKARQLKNGMKILTLEDHSIPNIALYFFYHVGSRNEHVGITGLSHFFEHMMFNGAKKYGPGMFDRRLEDSGGSNNAYTSEDITVYQDWIPSSALPLTFDLESDRMSSLAFDPKMVASEREVVANERRLTVDNNNAGILNEQLMASAFLAHPYHWPVLGWMSDIENWKRQDLLDYFKTYYAPNNCEMVVVGDFKTDEVVAAAEKYFGSIPTQPTAPPVTTKEPEQLGEHRVYVNKFAQLPMLSVAYHSPAGVDPDFIPLNILEYILLRGESSRLYKRLVDQEQVAISVDGGQSEHTDPFVFLINVQPRSGVDPGRVEKILYDELARINKDLVDPQELQKAKNSAVADFYRGMKTNSGKANVLGFYDVVEGDYHRLFTRVDLLNKVTREDVQRVVKKYFSERNRTVAILIPEAKEPEKKSNDAMLSDGTH